MNSVIDGNGAHVSMTEVYGNIHYGDGQSDGTQYEYYKSKGVTTSNYSGASSSWKHWTRSVAEMDNHAHFRCVHYNGFWDTTYMGSTFCVFPAWCF